ncbi:MAG: class I mannose-6-phosphate isomerase, partial [Halobacteriovoraceae bacterium]|nr:class I mannose-6-phosphate isomerase [Halobacteriovoraceae bacterium]
KRVENSFGKTECWIILEADIGAGIYLGLKKGVDKETLESAIKEKEDLSRLLNFYPVEKGDFFFVPAGSIHAIGKGVTLAEVQQSSGVTYRVWDWNRVGLDGKPRELHVEKALDVINFDPDANSENHFRCQKEIFKNKNQTIIEHKDFCVEVFSLREGESFAIEKGKGDRLRSLLVLEGKVSFQEMKMEPYRAYLLSSKDDYSIQGEEASKNSVCLIIS